MDKDLYATIKDAVARYKQEGGRGVDWVLMWMPQAQKESFDQALVAHNHPFAYQPGTFESRFRGYIAEQAQEAN